MSKVSVSLALVLAAIAATACAPTASPRGVHRAPTVAAAPARPTTPARAPAPAPFSVRVVGHGPPILLLPGLASPGSVWDDTVAHLQARYTCHVFTLAGFAGVPALPPGPGFMARERAALAAYIHQLKLERPIVIGHSLGGFLAFALASDPGLELGGVIAVDGVPYLVALGDPAATPASIEPRAAQLRELFAGLSAEAYARQNRAALATMISDPGALERVAQVSGASDPRAVGEAVYELMTTDLRPQMATVRAPVLLVAATREPGELSAYAAQIAAVPRHRVLAAATRHFVMLDAPDFWLRALDDFLAESAAGEGAR